MELQYTNKLERVDACFVSILACHANFCCSDIIMLYVSPKELWKYITIIVFHVYQSNEGDSELLAVNDTYSFTCL